MSKEQESIKPLLQLLELSTEEKVIEELALQIRQAEPLIQAKMIRTLVLVLQKLGNNPPPWNLQSQDALNWVKSLVLTSDKALRQPIILFDVDEVVDIK